MDIEKEENVSSEGEIAAYDRMKSVLSEALHRDGLDPDSLMLSALADKSSVYFGAEGNLFCRLRFRGKKNYVELPVRFQEEACKYGPVETPKHKATGTHNIKDYCKLVCKGPEDLDQMAPLFVHVIDTVIDEMPTDFGCCSRYVECSDAKKCVNPDKKLALQCYYLKNLRKGNILYGKNAIGHPIVFT